MYEFMSTALLNLGSLGNNQSAKDDMCAHKNLLLVQIHTTMCSCCNVIEVHMQEGCAQLAR